MTSQHIQEILDYQNHIVNDRLNYYSPHFSKKEKSFSEEICESLQKDFKSINPKFFYDKKGSKIFEDITKLPEYYLTRIETDILKDLQTDLSSIIGNKQRLVELGSGSSAKTRLLLDIIRTQNEKFEYFPIDISEILRESSIQLLRDYSNLHITGIIDTYEDGLKFIENYDDKSNLIAFLGSSLGNFCSECSNNFLKTICSTMKTSDLFLIGVDLVKEKEILERAYNDSKELTKKFNLNVLSRINKELDANFDLNQFSHYAIFNENKKRIEMYLKSKQKQTVQIPKASISLKFEKDELIHTEHSHKYSVPQIKKMMMRAGFEIKNIWRDDNDHYAVVLASKV